MSSSEIDIIQQDLLSLKSAMKALQLSMIHIISEIALLQTSVTETNKHLTKLQTSLSMIEQYFIQGDPEAIDCSSNSDDSSDEDYSSSPESERFLPTLVNELPLSVPSLVRQTADYQEIQPSQPRYIRVHYEQMLP